MFSSPLRRLAALFSLLALIVGIVIAYGQETPPRYDGLTPDTFLQNWSITEPIPVAAPDGEAPPLPAMEAAFRNEPLTPEAIAASAAAGTLTIDGTAYEWVSVRSAEPLIDLAYEIEEREFARVYAVATVDMPAADTVLMGLGSDDAVRMWVNGERIHENMIGRALAPDADLVRVPLRKGSNTLLLKIQNLQLGWGFALRPLAPSRFADLLLHQVDAGNIDGVHSLLTEGADPDVRNAIGLTPLHLAKIRGRSGVADALRAAGADPDIPMPDRGEIVNWLVRQRIPADEPGAAILIARNGEIRHQKGFGMADMAAETAIVPATSFRIGSITKQFTAAAILRLQEAGKLRVDAPLATYFPGFPRGDEVTLTHILTHTSGIHSYTDVPDFGERVTEEFQPDELLKGIMELGYDFDPGTAWRYNNSGYYLLGLIIEQVSGQRYGDYLRDTFFQPLGMEHTGVYRKGIELPREALGYAYINGTTQLASDWNMSFAGAAGALYSTVGDLNRWSEAVFTGKVLSTESLQAAHTPAVPKSGEPADAFGSKAGFGWMIDEYRGQPAIHHGGGLEGFSTYMVRFPAQNTTVVVLTNCLPSLPDVNAADLANRIAEVYLYEEMEGQESYAVMEGPGPDLDDYVGSYDYGRAMMTVTREGDRLFAQLTGQQPYEIFPSAPDEFFWKVVEARVEFLRDANGQVTGVRHHQGGRSFEAPRVAMPEPVAVDPARLENYTGTYALMPGVDMSVTRDGDRLFVQLTGQPRLELFAKSEDIFFLKAVAAEIHFLSDGEGAAPALELNQGGEVRTAKRK